MVLGEKHGTNYLPYTKKEIFFTEKRFHGIIILLIL